jgi:hypothetical protein
LTLLCNSGKRFFAVECFSIAAAAAVFHCTRTCSRSLDKHCEESFTKMYQLKTNKFNVYISKQKLCTVRHQTSISHFYLKFLINVYVFAYYLLFKTKSVKEKWLHITRWLWLVQMQLPIFKKSRKKIANFLLRDNRSKSAIMIIFSPSFNNLTTDRLRRYIHRRFFAFHFGLKNISPAFVAVYIPVKRKFFFWINLNIDLSNDATSYFILVYLPKKPTLVSSTKQCWGIVQSYSTTYSNHKNGILKVSFL